MSVLSDYARTWRNDAWVKPFFATYRKTLVLAIVLGVLTIAFASALMFTSGYLISISAEQPERGVFSLFIPLAFVQIFGLGKPFFGYLERLKSHDWILHMTSRLRAKLYRSIESEALLWKATHRIGDALGLLSDDIDHVQDLYLRTIFPAVIACAVWVGVCLVFGVCSPLFACFMVLAVGVYVAVLPAVSVTVNGARRIRMKTMQSELYADNLDNVLGIEDWVCSGRRDDYTQRIARIRNQIDTEKQRLAAFARMRNLAAEMFFGVVVIIVLAWAVMHFGTAVQSNAATGDITRPADWIAAFVIGLFPLLEVFLPLSDAAVQAGVHMDSVVRLNEMPIADEPKTHEGESKEKRGAPLPSAFGILLDNVGFSYEQSTDSPVLNGISLNIAPGEKIALLGPSGAGKSTVASLIRGDLLPSSGEVTIGGVPSCRLSDQMPQIIGVVEQETYLFNRSLLENIRLGDASISENKVEQALRDVGLGELLDNLPHGLKTLVDEAGLRFSGGERHRIALARVLVRNTPIVVLDEPAAALDPCTEHALIQTLLRVFADRTLIIITHHLLDMEHMDRIVFLDEGRIAMHGSPAELEATSERYRTLLAFDRGEV